MEGYSDVSRHLSKHINLDDSEEVKTFIAKKKVSEAHKQILFDKNGRYCEFRGLHFEKPFYRGVKRLAFVPTEQEINVISKVSNLINHDFK